MASAYAAHLGCRAAEYGVTVGGPISVDMKRAKTRKDEISGRSNRNVEKWMRGLENGTVYQGHARFESPQTVRVNGDLLEGDKFFINVGGRALVPPMPGLDQVPYLTNSSMMEVDYLPEHLVIIGGSYEPDPSLEADHEYTLLLQEWLLREGLTYPAMPMDGGQPNYFTINGRAYPVTDTIRMRVGETLKVRFIGSNNGAARNACCGTDLDRQQ